MIDAAILLAAYLVGSVPFAYLAARVIKGIDIRTVGSGNVGASNVFRAVGRGVGLTVLSLDILKGVAAVLIARALDAGDWLTVLAGFAAVIGHSWTIFLGFKGGKGVATATGMLITLLPFETMAALILFCIVVAAGRMISLGSIAAATALPVVHLAWGEIRELGVRLPTLVLTIAVAALVIWRHRANIARIASGTERRFSFRKGESL